MIDGKPFMQRLMELAGTPENALADMALREFKHLSMIEADGITPLHRIENSFALLAVALGWIDRPKVPNQPKVHEVIATDSVRLRDY